jgi:hypothetical protein
LWIATIKRGDLMGETDLSDSNVGTRLIRLLFSTLDRPAFWLLGIAYELFLM